ncbi:MAG TPA: glycosyltransferase, partial [Cytophagaceae bacterium]
MKVAIINISDKIGGSAIAAFRLSQALRKYFGTKFLFLVRSKSVEDADIFQTAQGTLKAKIERFWNIGFNLLGLQYVLLPFSPWFILEKLKEEKPDVVNINNTVGGFFMTSHIRDISQKFPVVWTLHDMWAFTANGAHTFGDEAWKNLKPAKNEKRIFPTIGINTGRWLINRKKSIYKHCDFSVVVPSKWLYNMAIQSPVLAGKPIYHIPHGLDLEKFRVLEKELIRMKLGLPQEAKVIIFIAQRIKNNFFKGGEDLFKILSEINAKTSFPIHVLLMGGEEIPELLELKNLIIHPLGYVSEEEKIIECLNAADIFLYPTRADNFPLVLLETIACGTPCVTFDVGGCGEIIQDNSSGYLIKDFDTEKAAIKMLEALANPN